jgi:hypothetical protein
VRNSGGGDQVFQVGDHSIGIIKYQAGEPPQAAPGEARVALAELNAAVAALRSQVSTDDRRVMDGAMETIGSGVGSDKGRLRRALTSIAGIAALVGDVGAPVVEAIRKVTAAFGALHGRRVVI